jgi:hypothetical protein
MIVKTLRTFPIVLMLLLPVPLAWARYAAPNNIDKITTAYLAVKNALTTGNGALAQTKAKDLLAALSDHPEKGLKPGQQKLLNSYLEKLKFDSRHISETNMVDHQREHFASLSKNLFEVVRGLKMNRTTVYMDYCPMKKAYWLSETAAIKNPYYSDKMMTTCGRVSSTLPAAK